MSSEIKKEEALAQLELAREKTDYKFTVSTKNGYMCLQTVDLILKELKSMRLLNPRS